ncbi:hypothetical protein ACE3ZB_004415 [Salmonella enterica]
MTNRARYRPWLNLPEDDRSWLTTDVKNAVRHGMPIFNRLPVPGDYYRWRTEGDKGIFFVRSVTERNDEIVITVQHIGDPDNKQSYSLDRFTALFRGYLRQNGGDKIAVEYGMTPAQILRQRGFTHNRWYRITLAIECAHGKWFSIYRRMGINIKRTAPADFACPLCGYHHKKIPVARSCLDLNAGESACDRCGIHGGLDVIASARKASLLQAAEWVLIDLFGTAAPEELRGGEHVR